MKVDVSVIVPFLNESENVRPLISAIRSFRSRHPSVSYEFIFVDDGSTDDSIAKIVENGDGDALFKILKLSKNVGSHAALRAGILHATGDLITFMYADLQDPIDLINRMHQASNGYAIVWAHRSQTSGKLFERMFSKMYARLMQRFVAPGFPSSGFDVVMFSSKVQAQLNQNIEANSSVFLQLLTLGFRQQVISYEKTERKFGKSKWTFSKKVKLLVDSFVAFSFAPIRAVTIAGIVLFIMGVLFSGYLIFRKLVYNDLTQGWAMLMSILMIGFGITNISLGILAEYLWRTLDSSRKRPVFIVDEIIELTKAK
jgi:polyisoprenyl-phosphate glycosyltransferase